MQVDLETIILWQDDALLAVNKPAGIAVLAEGWDPQKPYLTGLLREHFGRLWNVHRLDKETSGVLLLARSPQAHRLLNIQFEKRQVRKVYHALVVGQPEWRERWVRLPLRLNGDRRHRTVVDWEGGKPSETEFHLLEGFSTYALVEAILHSGRTHQIRAHLAAIGIPLVADALYGDGKPLLAQSEAGDRQTPVLQRAGLHARLLELVHPVTAQHLKLEAPYPPDFSQSLACLRTFC
jgi:tRNA pseudouridine32 synthase/23S rRNA pseudouridine746 synthase